MNQRVKFFVVTSFLFLMLVVVLSHGYAQEREETSIRTEAYSQTELMPENDSENARLVPKTVYYLEADRTVTAGDELTNGITPAYSGGGVNFTLSGRTSYYQYDTCNFMGGTGGKTRTTYGTCVDATYVRSKTKITGPSGTAWGYTAQDTNGGLGCNDNTNWHDTSKVLIAEGSNLIAYNDHKGKINGSWHEWLGLEDAQVKLIDYSCPY